MIESVRISLASITLSSLAGTALADIEYRYDDGISNITLGPPRSFESYGDIDILWGNYYFTEQATESVTRISFGLGELSADQTVTLWVFDDPDNDADPTNAVPLFSVSVRGQDLGFGFNIVDIAPTEVSGGFFVAVGHLAKLTYDASGAADYPAPARFDPDARADRSWFFYDGDIPEHDLASSGFVSRMDGPFVPIQGAFAVRATTIPSPGGVLIGLLSSVLAVRRTRRD